MAKLIRRIEEEDLELRSSLLETACEYKIGWQEVFEHARKNGLPDPDVVPYPDDVVLDMRRAEVRFEGPTTLQEKRKWGRLLEFRDELQAEVSLLGSACRECAAMGKPPLDNMQSTACCWEGTPECTIALTSACPNDTGSARGTGLSWIHRR